MSQNNTYVIVDKLKGLLLHQAFKIVRSAGFKLRVTSLDKEHRRFTTDEFDKTRINVEVVESIVRRAWVG